MTVDDVGGGVIVLRNKINSFTYFSIVLPSFGAVFCFVLEGGSSGNDDTLMTGGEGGKKVEKTQKNDDVIYVWPHITIHLNKHTID